ncbi:DUF4238 domain-containing protein [Porticoccus sp. GXU_MW_L64]
MNPSIKMPDTVNKPNNGPKWQHYLPCCYLKHFAHDGDWSKGRKSKVYFTDGEKSICVKVEDVGAEDYAYSKEFPEFDHEFHDMESGYPVIVGKIISGETLSKREYYLLITTMVDFNTRNIAYENQTDKERKEIYTAISRAFMEDIFFEAKGGGTDLQAMMDWFSEHWRLQPFRSDSGEKFITSDNPSTIFSHPQTGRPVMVYLPIHPDYALVAYDKRHLDVKGNSMSDDALGLLNGLQVNRCVRHVFSDHDILNGDDQKSAESLKRLLQRAKPKRYVTQEGAWVRDFIPTSEKLFSRLTFMKIPCSLALRNSIHRIISKIQSGKFTLGS